MTRPESAVFSVSPTLWTYTSQFPVDRIEPAKVTTESLRIRGQQHEFREPSLPTLHLPWLANPQEWCEH
jgi:hypothetical protein